MLPLFAVNCVRHRELVKARRGPSPHVCLRMPEEIWQTGEPIGIMLTLLPDDDRLLKCGG